MPQGRHDHAARRQARRLLRDLDAAVPAADPAGGSARDDGLGLRRGRGAEQARAAHPQRALAHDRGASGTGRCGSSGSTTWRTQTGTTCRTCCRSTRRCTGRTRPAARTGRDTRPTFDETPGPYTGPVPIVTHVHGAVGVGDESDGYAEAWYLPAASNIPAGYATRGHLVRLLRRQGRRELTASTWGPGFATFQYPNANRASTIWYHDHALGMTRLNVYAGPGRASTSSAAGRPATTRCSTGAPERTAVLPGPGADGRTTSSRRTRPTTRSRSRSRTARSTPTARSSTPTRGRSSTGSSARYIPDSDVLADLEPRVLRQHDHGQRQHVAVPDGRAAPLPVPVPQRLPVALPDPRLQRHPWRRGVADRQRGRLPRRPGEPHRRTTATGC